MKVKTTIATIAAAAGIGTFGVNALTAHSAPPATTVHVEFYAVNGGQLIAARDLTTMPAVPYYDSFHKPVSPYQTVVLNGRNYLVSSVRWVVGDAGTTVRVSVF